MKRALWIFYRDYSLSSKVLFRKDNSFCVHHRNIQSLVSDLFKIKSNISNQIKYDIFQNRTLNYNLRTHTHSALNNINTVYYGPNSLRYFTFNIWNNIPEDFKQLSNVEEFKEKTGN